jgi:hypothetical protein
LCVGLILAAVAAELFLSSLISKDVDSAIDSGHYIGLSPGPGMLHNVEKMAEIF